MKKLILDVITRPIIRAPFRALLADRAVVFVYHRFRNAELGTPGYDPATLRRSLEYLRREGREILCLRELVQRMRGGGPRLDGAVAFTIDDGYLDQATVAGPIFAAFDCPVTTFLTTGFLDGDLWFWWDKIEYIFEHTAKRSLEVQIGNETVTNALENEVLRGRAQLDFTARCKCVTDDEKHRAIKQLALAGEVELPEAPPLRYAPMSWEDARHCEATGMTFGPHTVTHPILSSTDDEGSRHELTESWRRLSAEMERPVPIFCYPNGRLCDFGERELQTLREINFEGAVIGIPGYVHARGSVGDPWMLRRFACPADMPRFVKYVAGVERLVELVRREDH